MIKDKNVEKDRCSDYMEPKDFKDPSTMESYPKAKERSLENSGGVGSPKLNKKKQKEESAQSPEKSLASQREKQIPEDNCLKCSKGFFFWFLISSKMQAFYQLFHIQPTFSRPIIRG